MRIQHNIMSMNAYRNYNNNTSALSKNLEKLSSGYKINRAGDDAAGLAISEKMRAQIAGLTQAQKNAKSGINLVQTAEGALQEVHDMLNRMYTLAEQSANGTYMDGEKQDRHQLQKEVNALREEINRISNTSNFNGIKLFGGGGDDAVTDPTALAAPDTKQMLTDLGLNKADIGAPSYDTAITNDDKTALAKALSEKGIKFTAATANGGELSATLEGYTVKLTTDGTTESKDPDAIKKIVIKSADGTTTLATLDADIEKGTIKAGDSTLNFSAAEGTDAAGKTGKAGRAAEPVKTDDKFTADFSKITTPPTDGQTITIGGKTFTFSDTGGKTAINSIEIGADVNESMENLVAALKADTGADAKAITDNYDVAFADGKLTFTAKKDGAAAPTIAAGTWATGDITVEAVDGDAGDDNTVAAGDIWLQIGEDADKQNRIQVKIGTVDAASLEIDKIDISTQQGAWDALDKIKNAIYTVSDIRGDLGAVQNRLEHTVKNLSVMTENIQDAESTIRDTDVADEMMAYTKNNILIQSAQAMLAQANQVPQGVLQLLQ